MAGCKYVKEFQFGGKVSNSPAPKKYADGGKVKSGLAAVERMTPQEKKSTADGIAAYAGGNKPGLVQRTIDAAKRANPKATAAMGFEPAPDEYSRGGPVTKHQKLATGQSIGYARGGKVEPGKSMGANVPMTKPDMFVNAPKSLSKGVDRNAPPSIVDNMARGGKIFARGGLPVGKGSIQDPAIKPFKKSPRRGKA